MSTYLCIYIHIYTYTYISTCIYIHISLLQVSISRWAYDYLAPELKLDRQVARQAVAQDGHVLSLLPKELQGDRELVPRSKVVVKAHRTSIYLPIYIY